MHGLTCVGEVTQRRPRAGGVGPSEPQGLPRLWLAMLGKVSRVMQSGQALNGAKSAYLGSK